MWTVLSLTPFQMVFIGGFVILACVLTVILRTRKLLSFAVIFVVALVLIHYITPLAQFVTSAAR